jgi:hypothetical protein
MIVGFVDVVSQNLGTARIGAMEIEPVVRLGVISAMLSVAELATTLLADTTRGGTPLPEMPVD